MPEHRGSTAENSVAPLNLPRLPVLGWSAFEGSARSQFPCILDRQDLCLTTSGRAAIALALEALGIGRGDRVLVPTYHCPTMIAPVVARGAEPVFFPTDATGCAILDALDPSRASGARAMIAAHYFGLPQPMAKVRAFCNDHNVALIEDCAHALFGVSEGRPVGRWGDYAIASLTKFLPVQEGGCLAPAPRPGQTRALVPASFGVQLRGAVNAIEIGAHFRRLNGLNLPLRGLFAIVAALRRNGSGGDPDEAPVESSDVTRWLADFAPESLVARAPSAWTRWMAGHVHRGRIVALRRRNYVILGKLVADLRGVRALRPDLPDTAAPYVFPLWVDDPERIYQRVRRAGIPVFRWDEVWPGCPELESDHGRTWATHVFQLGCHQDLATNDLERMVATLESLLTDRG